LGDFFWARGIDNLFWIGMAKAAEAAVDTKKMAALKETKN
jgi:hypothetical protein